MDSARNPSKSIDRVDVGDCIDEPPIDEDIFWVTVRSCDVPHDIEVFAVAPMGSRLRTEDALIEFCLFEFESYVGVDLYETDLTLTYIAVPFDEADFEDTAMCLLYPYDESKLIGSRQVTG